MRPALAFPPKTWRRSAMSLPEVAMAIALTTILILSLLAMFTRGMFVLSHSKQVDQATERGQQFLENVCALGAASITPGVYDSRRGDPPDGATGFPPSPYSTTPGDYPLAVTATTTGAPPGTIAVQVEVYYDQTQKITLQTYLNL